MENANMAIEPDMQANRSVTRDSSQHEAHAADTQPGKSAPRMRTSHLLEYMLFMIIPIVGFGVMLAWSLSRDYSFRRSLARAMLITSIVVFLLTVLIAAVVLPFFTSWLYRQWSEVPFEDPFVQPPQKETPRGGFMRTRIGEASGRFLFTLI